MFTHWITVDGSKITPREELPHDHLSNIYYYVNYIYPQAYDEETRRAIQFELDKRFEGKPLPYKPYYDWEITWLKSKGWLRPNGNIVYHEFGKNILLGTIN